MSALVASRGGSVSRLDAGDFFLTAAPPELVGEGGVHLGTAQRAKRRKVRSREELLAFDKAPTGI